MNAVWIFPCNAKITPRVPESRFIEVIVLGICLITRIGTDYFTPIFLATSFGRASLWTKMLIDLPRT